MKMNQALVLLLFLGVGVLARSQTLNSAKAEIAANELSERYARSASGESAAVAADEPPGKSREGDLEAVSKQDESPGKSHERDLEAVSKEYESPGKSHEGDLEAVSKEAGMKGSGVSGSSESENASDTKNQAKSVESGEDKGQRGGSSEENKGRSKESSQSGGKSKESGEDSGQLNGGGTGDQGAASLLQQLASILGLNISKITDLVTNYYTGSLPVTIEALLKAIGITTSLQEMQNTSQLLQIMKSIPIVGIFVSFLTNTLSVPINIIAVIFSLVTTILQHIPNLLPRIL